MTCSRSQVDSDESNFNRAERDNGCSAAGNARPAEAERERLRAETAQMLRQLRIAAQVHVVLLLLGAAAPLAEGYLPVIMMHGVGSTGSEMLMLKHLAESLHPGTMATTLRLYEHNDNHDSLQPLNVQVKGVIKGVRGLVAANPTLYANGWHMVCKSQGALICRCVLEEMNDHRVQTFISLAGPQMGVYGDTFFKSKFFPHAIQKLTKDEVYWLAYRHVIQEHLSVANIWRDPKHAKEFVQHNQFLPVYNGLRTSAPTLARYKRNFLRLNRTIFCVGSGSEYDGGIEPWQSAVWSYPDASGAFVPMEQTQEYSQDLFGLKTLDETGRLEIKVVPGASHHDWTASTNTIKEHVLPHLT